MHYTTIFFVAFVADSLTVVFLRLANPLLGVANLMAYCTLEWRNMREVSVLAVRN